MPYIKRTPDGTICAVYSEQDSAVTAELEFVSAQNEELQQFIAREGLIEAENRAGESAPVLQALQNSDQELARVTEDLINLLVEKQIILFTELPPAVQSKLLDREKLRSSLRPAAPNLLDDEDTL